MTSRKVTVIESIEKAPSNHCFHDESDDGILIDTTPDIAVIYLEGAIVVHQNSYSGKKA